VTVTRLRKIETFSRYGAANQKEIKRKKGEIFFITWMGTSYGLIGIQHQNHTDVILTEVSKFTVTLN
jgi:hypothetical protein